MNIAKFEFSLRTLNSFGLPDFKGSTFRGKFGHVLKHTICIVSHRKCETCELAQECAYQYLFQTKNKKGQEVPRPFLLEPPLTRKRFFLKNEVFYLNLLLMGKAIDYLPYFLYGFMKMGEEGIGMDKGKFDVFSLKSLNGDGNRKEIYSSDTQKLQTDFDRLNLFQLKEKFLPQLTLQFLTPTYIQMRGQILEEIEFETLVKTIIRRFKSLSYFHSSAEKVEYSVDFKNASEVEIVHSDLKMVSYQRYSNRQKKNLPLTGFTGKITYRGEIGPFYPWLKIGEYLHVGKGTVFGMGWYRILL